MRNSPITVRSDPPRRVNSPVRVPPPDSESESDENPVSVQRHSTSYSQDPLSRYRVLPEVAVEPPRWSADGVTAGAPPQKVRSESDSGASYASVPRRSSTESTDSRKATTRYRVLPEVKPLPVEAKPQPPRRAPSPMRPPPPDDSSDSDQLAPLRRSGSSEREENHRSAPRVAMGAGSLWDFGEEQPTCLLQTCRGAHLLPAPRLLPIS
ncbi:hypothetical protein fugu_005648 [Takifugu bimaculatus]|uniref:Uncharacterized protein n=1 Tax=Takifugu bimaculatus TaxID=433685 RepID=A0A4Z2B5K9_9TELE|nr:hypothetical protein fugu_005648 [Takifugu bimaculatus]